MRAPGSDRYTGPTGAAARTAARRSAALLAVALLIAGCGSSSGGVTATPSKPAAATGERYTLDLEATIDERLVGKYLDKSLLGALCGAQGNALVTCMSRGRIYRVTRNADGDFAAIRRDHNAETVCNRVAFDGCTLNTVPLPGHNRERIAG